MKGFERISDRNIKLITIQTLFLNMIFVLPVIVPYYRDEIGIGFREFMIGETVFSAIVVLMEVPTGWVADIWTRRKTMLASMLANIAGYFILWRADSFFEAVAAQAVIAVGVSLMSGAISALLYESLMEDGREGEFRRREGFRVGFGLYVIAASCAVGGFLYGIDHRLPAFLSFATSVAGLCATLAIKEPARHRQAVHKNPFADVAQAVRYAVRGHAEVGGIMVLSAILFACTKITMWSQQPYYVMLGMSAAWMGVLGAAGFLLGGISGQFGHVFDGRFSNVGVLAAFIGWVAFVCLACGLFPGWHAVPLLLAGGTVVFGLCWPRAQAALNRRVDSARRATILSAANMGVHLISMPLMLVTGWITDEAGIRWSLLFMAALLAAGAVAALPLVRRRHGRKAPVP